MNTTELANGIYSVGAVDWDVRDFHGYSTYKGTTYNAFLIVDEKVTLFDTVKFLLEHMPEQMHIVISTRSDPPLPIARLRSQNQLLEMIRDKITFSQCHVSYSSSRAASASSKLKR